VDQFTKQIFQKAAIPTGAVGLVMALVFWIAAGAASGVGALLGVAIVLPFFLVGQVLLARVLRSNPQMAMTVAMAIYLVKIGVLAVLLFLLAGATAFDTKAFAATILTCTLVWTAAEVYIFATTKVLYVEPEAQDGPGPDAPSAQQLRSKQ